MDDNNRANPLWFNVSTHINTLLERRNKLINERTNIEEQISEINQSIALLQLLSPLSARPTTSTVPPSARPTTSTVEIQTTIHLPSSQHLMTTRLMQLQIEEEERKLRIVKSFQKKK
jgi:hypothetical protein